MHDKTTPVSDELQTMADKERARWLTVAEAQKVRDQWTKTRNAIDKAVEKFDEDPENATNAIVFVVLAALTNDGFSRTTYDAAEKLREYHGDR